MKAQKLIEILKELGLVTASAEAGCYTSRMGEKVSNLLYHCADPKEIDGGWLFTFQDKSSVEADGSEFIVRNDLDTSYRLKTSQL